MKFSRDFEESLKREEYPPEWLDSAISYRKLKKCIKQVQSELESIGLDSNTLDRLWQNIPASSSLQNDDTPQVNSITYSFSKFTPKLTIALDPQDGSPVNAWLSPDTRRHLQELARSQKLERRSSRTSARRPSMVSESLGQGSDSTEEALSVSQDGYDSAPNESGDEIETIEIPLTSDSKFFQILNRELTSLEVLQTTEKKQLEREIIKLGDDIGVLKSSNSRSSKREIQAIRAMFEEYTDSQIFFSSHEQDAGARTSIHAQAQLQAFTKSIAPLKANKAATAIIVRFLSINSSLLRFQKFQELNTTALAKILKKFDKRTSLPSRPSISSHLLTTPFLAQTLAKSTCFTISQQLLTILPNLNDYLCPVCFSISFKPVRLDCSHIFCIRCLIVMQRAKQDHCPLCRHAGVLEVTSEHLDPKLAAFLKRNFPAEVKEKQRANEIAAGVDRFGAEYEKHHNKCIVM